MGATGGACLFVGLEDGVAFSHRGYNSCANLLRKTLPARDIAIKLNPDATFEFPYGDGYWSKLLNRSFRYEDELELLFRDSVGVDYMLDRLRREFRLLVGADFERALRVAQGDRDRAVIAEFRQAQEQLPKSTATASRR